MKFLIAFLCVLVIVFMKYGLGLESSSTTEQVVEEVAETIIKQEIGTEIDIPDKK